MTVIAKLEKIVNEDDRLETAILHLEAFRDAANELIGELQAKQIALWESLNESDYLPHEMN